jgi:hypothetical protein
MTPSLQLRNPGARAALATLVATLLCSCASTSRDLGAPPATFDLSTFCADAQQRISGTPLRADNVLHTDYEAFVKSKPGVRPLRTEQYVWFDDEARTQPKMISCKMKTSDHIATEYGADQTTGEGQCADINRATLERVLAGIGPAERRRLRFARGTQVVFEPEVRTTDGPVWLAPFALTTIGSDGALHIHSKAMRNDWLDPALAQAPPQFKGTRYCHLIAPQYLARLLRGEVHSVNKP